MNRDNFVFLDINGKRWPRLRGLLLVSLLVLFAALIVFIRSLLVLPRLERLENVRDLSKNVKALMPPELVNYRPQRPPSWFIGQTSQPPLSPAPSSDKLERKDLPVRLGFTVKWDRSSRRSLKQHGSHLTHLAPEWFTVAGTPPVLSANPDRRVQRYAVQHGLAFLPLLTNLSGNEWEPEGVESLLRADPVEQNVFFSALIDNLKNQGAHGTVIDFEQIDPVYSPHLTEFFSRLHGRMTDEGLELWLCIPVGNDIKIFDLQALSGSVDRFVALLYDETGEEDSPGPLASRPWFSEWLHVLVGFGRPEQWVIGVGAYAYDWNSSGPAAAISFPDAMARAGLAGGGAVHNSPPYYAPHFAYSDRGSAHSVWFLDALTFHNQRRLAEEKRAGGIAVWRLGLEDPGIWKSLECGSACALDELEKLPVRGVIATIGEGDFMTTAEMCSPGLRRVTARDGELEAVYERYPKYPLVYRQGELIDNEVSLTFDDGPDPEWTPEILNILGEKGVKAAFFVTGANAASYPELIRRIAEEGHELGNHTYTHTDLTRSSEARLQLELNATQRVIETITGRSTLLFRPPYKAGRDAVSLPEFRGLNAAQMLGYIPVSESIDSEDWRLSGEDAILHRIKTRRQHGNVLLFHDAGGDRSQTVAALPSVIDYLQRRGDRIVPLSTLLSVDPNALMPSIPKDEPLQSRLVAGTGFRLLYIGEELLWAFMIVSTVIVILRTAAVIALAALHRASEKKRLRTSSSLPPVSVLIAAYNEQNVIEATIKALLRTRYQGPVEIIVVDDGSKDDTAEIVARMCAADPRLTLIRQPNTGKASALSAAIDASTHEHLVMLDADTLFEPETIERLILGLEEEGTSAVSGQAKVANSGGVLGRLQDLEYLCGFNLDRRAYDMLNCITVVPGAVSAVRRSTIRAAGGIARDTMAEDTDLTLTIHRLGGRVRYEAAAIGWTEAPADVRALVRQRTRWAFGTLQCLWKHRDMLFDSRHKTLGFFSLPSVWFCHMLLVSLIPLVDLCLIVSLISGSGMAVIDYAVLFLLVDLLAAAAACLLEGAGLKKALWIIPMRVLYRPLLAWAVWAALLRALRGAWVGWGRQDRRGVAPECAVGLALAPAGRR